MRYAAFVAVILIFLSGAAVSAPQPAFVVVANKNGPLAPKSDKNTISNIFRGDKQYMDGVRLRPINYAEGRIKDEFLETFVGMNSKDYRLHWTKKVFQEGGSMPPSVESSLSIAEMIRRDKGAVAYVPVSKLAEVQHAASEVIVIWP